MPMLDTETYAGAGAASNEGRRRGSGSNGTKSAIGHNSTARHAQIPAENLRLMHSAGYRPPSDQIRSTPYNNPCINLPTDNLRFPDCCKRLNRTFGSAATGPPTPTNARESPRMSVRRTYSIRHLWR